MLSVYVQLILLIHTALQSFYIVFAAGFRPFLSSKAIIHKRQNFNTNPWYMSAVSVFLYTFKQRGYKRNIRADDKMHFGEETGARSSRG